LEQAKKDGWQFGAGETICPSCKVLEPVKIHQPDQLPWKISPAGNDERLNSETVQDLCSCINLGCGDYDASWLMLTGHHPSCPVWNGLEHGIWSVVPKKEFGENLLHMAKEVCTRLDWIEPSNKIHFEHEINWKAGEKNEKADLTENRKAEEQKRIVREIEQEIITTVVKFQEQNPHIKSPLTQLAVSLKLAKLTEPEIMELSVCKKTVTSPEPREVKVNIDDFKHELTLAIAESDMNTMDLLDVQTVIKTDSGQLVSIDLSNDGIDRIVNFSAEILENSLFDEQNNSGKSKHLLKNAVVLDPKDVRIKRMEQALLGCIDAFYELRNAQQITAIINCMDALGWEKTFGGFKDPRNNRSLAEQSIQIIDETVNQIKSKQTGNSKETLLDCNWCKGSGKTLDLDLLAPESNCNFCGGTGKRRNKTPKYPIILDPVDVSLELAVTALAYQLETDKDLRASWINIMANNQIDVLAEELGSPKTQQDLARLGAARFLDVLCAVSKEVQSRGAAHPLITKDFKNL
jgi:hypothetical protein